MRGALIVTALLDAASQAHFDGARERHFPASLNFLRAHVTLFHALPGEARDSVAGTLDAVSSGERRFAFETCGLRFLGRGVAYDLRTKPLIAVRARLEAVWRDWLTPQDRQGFRPHITVQNKVSPADARRLLAELQAAYLPWHGEVQGLALWRYEGGPWTQLEEMPFGSQTHLQEG